MEYITQESINKIYAISDNKQYISNETFEEEVINELLNILRNDVKFQEFSKQQMKKIILGYE